MYFNKSTPSEFIVLGFPGSQSTQHLIFLILLIIYLLTLLSNFVIITITWRERNLQSPMYFYLRNLSFLELCYVSVTVPNILNSIALHKKSISFSGCITQMFFVFFLGSTECFLFGVMAYDRYLAVCHPLRYTTLMTANLCFILTVCSVIVGFITTFPHVVLISQLPFCRSNVIDHFFCDAPPLLQLSCADTYVTDIMDFVSACLVILTSFTVTLISYSCIIMTVIMIPTNRGRRKTFSTCSAHLIVVCIYYTTVIAMYVRPKLTFSFTLNRVMAIFYTVITPILNPIIYCLRNRDFKAAIKKQVNILMNGYVG